MATDSGKEGHKGFVTDLFDPADFDMVVTCGPEIMMEKPVSYTHLFYERRWVRPHTVKRLPSTVKRTSKSAYGMPYIRFG